MDMVSINESTGERYRAIGFLVLKAICQMPQHRLPIFEIRMCQYIDYPF